MTEPLLKVVREVILAKLESLNVSPSRHDYLIALAEFADEIARNVMQAFMPTLESYVEACALLDQTLGLLDPRDFRSPEDQQKIAAAKEFLGGIREIVRVS